MGYQRRVHGDSQIKIKIQKDKNFLKLFSLIN